jgi:Heterokaryon incompatibility protein (HET)
MTTIPSYLYNALPSQSSFRILHLLPGKGTELITYSLHVADWENPSEYEAISYAWGDPHRTLQTICDGKVQQITYNLWQALWHLRLKDRSRCLWADAVW